MSWGNLQKYDTILDSSTHEDPEKSGFTWVVVVIAAHSKQLGMELTSKQNMHVQLAWGEKRQSLSLSL